MVGESLKSGVAVITNVRSFAGEPMAAALTGEGFRVLCHDPEFANAGTRAAYDGANPGRSAAAATSPEELVEEAAQRFGRHDAAVSNDAFPARRTFIDVATADEYRTTIEALLVAPFRLAAAAARCMRPQGAGRIVLLTSALPLHPYPGFAMYASARAGAGALAQALAKEVGPWGIQINAVAPNFLASETYYPKAQWVDDPKYVQRVERCSSRCSGSAGPEEIGALVAFLLSGKSDFVTGQVIAFTGGWP